MDDVRRRIACDRCHTQKLRCPRKSGLTECDRCSKAQTPCVFSPFRQKRVPNSVDGNELGEVGKKNSPLGKLHRDSADEYPVTADDRESTYVRHETAGVKRRRLTKPQENDPPLNLLAETCVGINMATEAGINNDCSPPAPDMYESEFMFDDLGMNISSAYLPLSFNSALPFLQDESSSKSGSLTPFQSPAPPAPEPILNSAMDPNTTSALAGITSGITQAIKWNEGVVLDDESTGRCVQRLSKLSTELYEHGTTLPPLSIHDPVTPEEELELTINPQPLRFNLDETFHLTQEMINIYPSILSLCSQPQQTRGPASSHARPSPGYKSQPTIDHSFVFLALSCHLRIVELYEKIFEHMEVCIGTSEKGSIAAPNIKQAQLTVPTVKFGSFTPPQSSTVPMHFLLITQFASQLSHYASELVTQIRSSEGRNEEGTDGVSNAHDAVCDPTAAAADSVMIKATRMTQYLSSVRNMMLNRGLFA